MAIHFARCNFIQRGTGNSATRVAAYNSRSVIINDRTGERHDSTKWKGDLQHHEVALPAGAAPEITASVLSNLAEAAERRHDARVGREFILALPKELSPEDRLILLRSFVKEHFTDKGLAVQIDIHNPHDDSVNYHAHLWTPMRRVENDHLAATQARDLLGAVRTSPYGVFVSEAERWGQLWTIHQQRFFYQRRLDIRVDPIALDPGKRSYGPKRAWGKDPEHSRVADLIAEHRRLSAERARDAMAVFEHLRKQPWGFTVRDLAAFVAKHLADPKERAEVYAKAENAWVDQIVRDLWADRGTVRHSSGSRYLQVEDIAHGMSPQLASLQDEAKRLQRRRNAVAYGMERRQSDFSEADRRIAKVGILRKAVHHAILKPLQHEDLELHTLYGWRRSQKAAFIHLATREKHLSRRLERLAEAISTEWIRVSPLAEAELRRLQKCSADARLELSKIRVDSHSGSSKLAVLAALSEKDMQQLASADQLHAMVNKRFSTQPAPHQETQREARHLRPRR